MDTPNTDKFKPTTEWMQEWYDRMNSELFDGRLGGCILRPFTAGKGSQGSTLGWFKILGSGVKVERNSRRIVVSTYFGREYVDNNNFVNKCQPRIELNANYAGTQEAWLGVLVHEMCHYYTYMNGYAPKQGHGPEFYAIGRKVCQKSNGRFIIERLASAETMKNMELDDKVKQSNDKRKENKKNRMVVCAIALSDPHNPARWIMTTQQKVIDEVLTVHKSRGNAEFIGINNDQDLISELVNDYQSFRSYRGYYPMDYKMMTEFLKHKWTKLLGNSESLADALGMKDKSQENKPQEEEFMSYRIVQDGNGYNLIDLSSNKKVFSNPVDGLSYDKSQEEFKFRLGKFNFEGMPGKWKKVEQTTTESRHLDYNALRSLVKEAITDYLNGGEEGQTEDSADYVEIQPDMNLGLYSPLEMV